MKLDTLREDRLVGKERALEHFKCECAERVLPVYEQQRPGDDRARKAIETKRAWLRGQATNEELVDAWGDAWLVALHLPEGPAKAAAWSAVGAAADGAYWATARQAVRAGDDPALQEKTVATILQHT